MCTRAIPLVHARQRARRRGALDGPRALKASGAAETVTQQQVETAIWTRFPCPFSPYRAEVLPATAKHVEGVWLFPFDSQPYR